jgi:hypothetical protein
MMGLVADALRGNPQALQDLVDTLGSPSGGPIAISDVVGLVAALAAKQDAGSYQPSDADLTAIAALVTTSFGRSFLELADAAAERALLGLGSAALQPSSAFQAAGSYQPLDSDLTAIAALTTTSFGRSFLALADAAAAQTLLGLGSAALQPSSAFQAAGSYQPLDSDLTAIAALTTTAFGRSFLDRADAAAARTLLGLVIGTDVQAAGSYQPLDSDLTAIAALTTTAFGRSFLDRADAAAARTLLGLVIGTDVQAAGSYQPLDSDLTAIAALTTTAFGRSFLDRADAAAARTLLGLVIGTDVAPPASPVFTGNVFAQQPTPTAKSASATLTIAELLTGIVTATSATAVAFTLPTGTLTDAGILGGALAADRAFEWVVINLGSSSGAVTVGAGTAHTIVGSPTVAIGTSARFRTRKTATNTFVTYRIA